MIYEKSIDEFLGSGLPIIDVRSPAEFKKGHIPGAFNIPLFSNEERAQVGTVYKKRSQQEAIELGRKIVAPKLEWFVEQSEAAAPNGQAAIHCWRGGMRSQAFAQHLGQNGFDKLLVAKGGYQAYRNFVLSSFEKPFKLKIVGGYTGSGKTHILEELQRQGHQIVDLEFLAKHKGSAFGQYPNTAQPTVEQFENDLFTEMQALDPSQSIWLEDESHSIGSVYIPLALYNQMKHSVVFFIDVPIAERAKLLVEEYSKRDTDFLAQAIQKISKRLGGQSTKLCLERLQERNFLEVALITLTYYDKAYMNSLTQNHEKNIYRIEAPDTNSAKNFKLLLKSYNAL